MYFLFLTNMNQKYIIHPSKRDTHKQISRCSLKTCDEKSPDKQGLVIRLHKMEFFEWCPLQE